MIDFPIDELLDDSTCTHWLERHLHPDGLLCPRRVGGGRAVRPFLRPLVQTARTVGSVSQVEMDWDGCHRALMSDARDNIPPHVHPVSSVVCFGSPPLLPRHATQILRQWSEGHGGDTG